MVSTRKTNKGWKCRGRAVVQNFAKFTILSSGETSLRK